MARRPKPKLTELERRELRQIWRDYITLGLPLEDVERKVLLYQSFIVQNRSIVKKQNAK